MDIPALPYDGQRGRYTVSPEHGPHAGATFAVELKICADPFCGCTDITFACTPRNEGEAPLEFSLDIAKRRISRQAGARPSSRARELAESLVAELRSEDWAALWRHLYAVKQAQVEGIDWRTAEATFPDEVMSDPTVMIGYNDVVRFAHVFQFDFGLAQWIADDTYCVNPECDCTAICLDFLCIRETPDGAEIVQHQPPVGYDYKQRTFKPFDPARPEEPPLEGLTEALAEAYPDFEGEVRRRHELLRALYRNTLKRQRRPAAPSRDRAAQKKMGPNAPCPCGSGKKYKKCCGRV